MGRGLSPLKIALGCLAVGVLALLGFLILQGIKPTIKNPRPLNGSRTPKGIVTVGADVFGEANLKDVRLKIDGRAVQPEPAKRAITERHWEVRYEASLPRGPHDAEIVAIDARGREQTYRWSFTAAGPSSLPKFANPLPRNGARLPAGEALISLATFSDATQIRTLKLTLNGRAFATENGATSASERTIAAVRRSLDAGEYTVTAEATDSEGEVARFEWKFTVVAPGQGAPDTLFFPQTGAYVFAPFADYWARNGGLSIFGLPITPDFEQNGLTIQWFERARFEKHPELPSAQQVQLGLLGTEARKPDPRLPGDPGGGRRFFPQTGHSVGGIFLAYWERNGGLAQFGLPLTEEIDENGLRVQWFERARLEYHPEAAGTPNEVQLGQLGVTLWRRTGGR